MNITVAGSGYVGTSLAVLLAQKELGNDVIIVDILTDKVEKINNRISPIKDEYIEKYLANKQLNLKATTDGSAAYSDADFVIIATPTNYDPKANFFDTSAVESVIESVIFASKDNLKQPVMVIKSTIPVGYTESIKKSYGIDNIIFSPEFLRESKALYDNLYPSRIIVGSSDSMRESAEQFSKVLSAAALNTPEVLHMNATEAEAVKLFANTYLALRVAYFNELDTYAESKGLNTASIIAGVSLDTIIRKSVHMSLA